jgi:hypothetical protein
MIRLSEFVFGNAIHIREINNWFMCFSPDDSYVSPQTRVLYTESPLGEILNQLYYENLGDSLFYDT